MSTRERSRFRTGATDVSAYVLPLREPTVCSSCDELCTDLAWCEWCRPLICPDCVRIMARILPCNFSDYSELSDGDGAVLRGVGVAVPPPAHVKYTRGVVETERMMVVLVRFGQTGTIDTTGKGSV